MCVLERLLWYQVPVIGWTQSYLWDHVCSISLSGVSGLRAWVDVRPGLFLLWYSMSHQKVVFLCVDAAFRVLTLQQPTLNLISVNVEAATDT